MKSCDRYRRSKEVCQVKEKTVMRKELFRNLRKDRKSFDGL